MKAPSVRLWLARQADVAWGEVIAPWLSQDGLDLCRSYVLVPTRGQAFGLKQRCLTEGIALFGVEFLTPGLARQKWLAAITADAPEPSPKPVLGRELLLFGLRVTIDRRLSTVEPRDPRWGFLKTLQSDPERVLEDFDDLLTAGFGPADFPLSALREIFAELVTWTEKLGYDFASRQAQAAALTPVPADGRRVGGRLLVYGVTAEGWNEFFNIAALARRFDDVTVVLPDPEFRGRHALDEAWVELWQALLGVTAEPLAAETDLVSSREDVAAVWEEGALGRSVFIDTNAGSTRPDRAAAPAGALIGRTRRDEMRAVADEIARLVEAGAAAVAVVFPRVCPAHLDLTRLLVERAIPFADLLEVAGNPALEVQIERALLAFYERGGRIEELLALWPLLRAAGHAPISLGQARDVCERLFDENQTHGIAAYLPALEASEREEWREVGRVVKSLMPLWPEELSLANAIERAELMREHFGLASPPGWTALVDFAERETRVLPAQAIFGLLASFLPESSAASDRPGRGVFAPVLLGTRRRMEGLAFSHLILVHANAGIWPAREEASSWLTDEQRTALNQRSRFSLGLFTTEDHAWLEKRGYVAMARDTREQVFFSASLYDDEDPETLRMPNSWLERLLWAKQSSGPDSRSFEEFWVDSAVAYVTEAEPKSNDRSWLEIWRRRRDPLHPFDEFFFSVDPAAIPAEPLPARLIERAVRDPAELWFEKVLRTGPVNWRPLTRARKKALGQLAHRVLAAALREPSVEGNFGEKPSWPNARAKLVSELDRLRVLWPRDRYWDSFHGELARICGVLLENVYALPTGNYLGVEVKLPRGAWVPLDATGGKLDVYGRVDLAFSDRAGWAGASMDIVDFKTGADAKLSVERMGRDGSSLQLGIYLAAAASQGLRDGRVWMVKPEPGAAMAITLEELAPGLVPLEQIGRHLASGRYGALTREPSEYANDGYTWPLACVPVPWSVLEQKFAVTFGVFPQEEAALEPTID